MSNEFTKAYWPNVAHEYERSSIPWNSLTIGTIVVTINPGLYGKAGALRKVIGFGSDKTGKYAILANDTDKDTSLLYESVSWWKDVAIIDNLTTFINNHSSHGSVVSTIQSN